MGLTGFDKRSIRGVSSDTDGPILTEMVGGKVGTARQEQRDKGERTVATEIVTTSSGEAGALVMNQIGFTAVALRDVYNERHSAIDFSN